MDIDRVKQIARVFLTETYGIELSIPVERNNRLRTTQGRYVIKHDDTPLRIELSGQTLEYGTEGAIIGIVKHECIHYALHQLGKPYQDGSAYFEAELKKHDAPRTGTCFIGKLYTFTCDDCGQVGETWRKQLTLTPEKYRTTCCRDTLTWIGEKIYNGSNELLY